MAKHKSFGYKREVKDRATFERFQEVENSLEGCIKVADALGTLTENDYSFSLKSSLFQTPERDIPRDLSLLKKLDDGMIIVQDNFSRGEPSSAGTYSVRYFVMGEKYSAWFQSDRILTGEKDK